MTDKSPEELQRERDELLARLREIDESLGAKGGEGSNLPSGTEENRTANQSTSKKKKPSVRDLVLDLLGEAGTMLFSTNLSHLCRAIYGREVPSTRFGTLSSDERKAFTSGRKKPVYLAHGLTYDRGEAIKRVWGRSDWSLSERIVGPHTGRIVFLKYVVWLTKKAELAESDPERFARPDLISYMAADAARDLGFRVKTGQPEFEKWRNAALDELGSKESGDREVRETAAERLYPSLNETENLFGVADPFTVLPGTSGDWRSSQ